jgi:hypothetical protein
MAYEPPPSSSEQEHEPQQPIGEPDAGIPVRDLWLDDTWGRQSADPESAAQPGARDAAAEERARRRQAPRRPSSQKTLAERVTALRGSKVAPTALVAVIALIAFVVWLVVSSGGSGSKSSSPASNQAVVLSFSGLQTIATTLHAPMFWVGTKPNSAYELTQTTDGKFLIRYVPNGTAAGAGGLSLTVGTYPVANAYNVARAAASQPSAVKVPVGGTNAIAFYGKNKPTSVYVTFPGVDDQIEVFAPSGALARRLVSQGRLKPVPGSLAPPDVRLLSAAGLRAYAASSAQPIFWAGPRQGVQYELTRKADGSTLVRYLPTGTELGDPTLQLTVGSYPIANAYGVTKGAAEAPGAVVIKLSGRGVGLYNGQRPSNVYVSRPSWGAQVEVFDPDATAARTLVSTEQIVQVK